MGWRDPPGDRRLARVLESRRIIDEPWMALRSDTLLLADGRTASDRVLLEHPDWVDVIALTRDLTIVLVEQYRHPIRQVRTEFPAGAVEGDESPLAAIQREFREETGYVSDDWRLLGSAAVNPAWQNNRIHSFLALGARRAADQDLDAGELIRPRELPFAEFVSRVEAGDLELPALQLAGLYWLYSRVCRSTDPMLAALRARGGL
jgi:8-oxo-dGTP pyrophosphatase MutT (NUDIX family)